MENITKFQLGETGIRISDKYCRDVSPEEVQKILDNIVAISIRYLQQKSA